MNMYTIQLSAVAHSTSEFSETDIMFAAVLLFIVVYGISYFFYGAIRSNWPKQKLARVGAVLSILIAAFTSYLVMNSDLGTDGASIIATAILVNVASVTGLLSQYLIRKDLSHVNARDAMRIVERYGRHNRLWREEVIAAAAKKSLSALRADYSQNSPKHFKDYMTDEFAAQNTIIIDILKAVDRTYVFDEINVRQIDIIDAAPPQKHTEGYATLCLRYEGDRTIYASPKGGSDRQDVADEQSAMFMEEHWKFVQRGNKWLVDNIIDPFIDDRNQKELFINFAKKNNLHYSPQLSYALSPQRALLFEKYFLPARQATNNLFGLHNSTLLQLYNYQPSGSTKAESYTVMQIQLPKAYKGMIVRSKHDDPVGDKLPATYKRLILEWQDFNNLYEVYADKSDSLPTLELLNPGFMAALHDTNPLISIEVIDRTALLYTKLSADDEIDDYQAMLDLAHKVYDELRL